MLCVRALRCAACGALRCVAYVVHVALQVRALRGVVEANEVAVAMGSNKRFKVHLGSAVDTDGLFSLRLDDVMPLQQIRVTVQVVINTHGYRAAMGTGGSGGGDSRGVRGGWSVNQEAWCTCELDEVRRRNAWSQSN